MPENPSNNKPNTPSRLHPALLAGLIVLAAFVVYFPAINGEFLWEDSTWLKGSATTPAPDGILRAWYTADNPDYWPLTASMFWIEYRLFGDEPTGYHAVNILLHALGAILLWRVLLRLKIPCAWLIALIFTVHPVCVMSVAWITELKNTLSLVLFMLAILLFLRHEDKPKWSTYVDALVVFFLALTAKTSTITLPAILLGLAWWRRERIAKRDLLRTAPFFALSGIFAATTILFQYGKAIGTITDLPQSFAERICIAGRAFWFYIRTTALPVNLSIINVRWEFIDAAWWWSIPSILVVALLIVFFVCRRTWGRPFFAATGYSLAVLLPVLGFVNMSFMQISFVSDHFQYLALPAIIALIVGGGWAFADRYKHMKIPLTVLAVICVTALAFASTNRARAFQSDETLWNQALKTNPGSWTSHMNLGKMYDGRGNPQKAIEHYTKAIALKNDYAQAYSNRGVVYESGGAYFAAQGNSTEAARLYAAAISDHSMAISIKPQLSGAWNNRGLAYIAMGRMDKAHGDFTEAIRLEPDQAQYYQHRSIAHWKAGQTEEALKDISRAIELGSDYAKAYELRADILASVGQLAKAIEDYRKAIELNSSLTRTIDAKMETLKSHQSQSQ